MNPQPLFRQLFDPTSSTYTYLIGDPQTKQAVLIDPVKEQLTRDTQILHELDLTLVAVFETHVHADHITSAGELRERFDAKIHISAAAGVPCADVQVADGATINVGALVFTALHTPGHTDGCISYVLGDRVFTGDTLMIRATGRTDFQSGSPEVLFDSIRNTLFALSPDTLVYPAHDYVGRMVSTIGEERQWNPRMKDGMTKETFVSFMNSRTLPYPKKIDVAVPANLQCGDMVDARAIDFETFKTLHPNGVCIDVRDHLEFEAFHHKEAVLKTLGAPLNRYLKEADKAVPHLFMCAMGKRSGSAVSLAKAAGIKQVYSLRNGIKSLDLIPEGASCT